MEPKEVKRHSKFLSFVLRHSPESIEIDLDAQGWVEIDRLIERCAAHGRRLTRELVDTVVSTNDKRRFEISPDRLRIRASQGHSVDVDLGYDPCPPPDHLFHGTVAENLDSIRATGLERRQRHHVHLSPDVETARRVGMRRGKPIVLVIRASEMARDGHAFYVSANGVWLTESVPPAYIEFPSA